MKIFYLLFVLLPSYSSSYTYTQIHIIIILFCIYIIFSLFFLLSESFLFAVLILFDFNKQSKWRNRKNKISQQFHCIECYSYKNVCVCIAYVCILFLYDFHSRILLAFCYVNKRNNASLLLLWIYEKDRCHEHG